MKQKKKKRYTNSQSFKAVENHGLETIKEIWIARGMYKTAEQLETSPYVIRYLAHKHEWQRPAEKAPAALQGVLNGNANAEYYRTLDFSGINLNNKKMEKTNNDT